ncbi:MAG TPA: RHS repeat-associated core domain-containing protein, partial [Polyangiaceae bacterium]|nr:RHS repeat-associated core domain-containing protein [Polyangiaceae bacterium]
DAQGNPTLVLGPDGSGTRFRYNQLGWPVEILDARGNVQRNAFDLRGKLRRVEEADGNVRDFEYDGEGRTEHVADRHHEILMTYSGMGRLATRTQAGTTVRFEYDTEEQLRTITNEHGVVYGFERGPLGEVTLEHGFDGVRRAYEYDPLGRVQRIERANGLQTHFDYDVLDRVVAVRHSDGTREAFAYGRDGMLARAEKGSTRVVFERDALGRVLREHQGDFWVQSEYDALGRRIRVASSLGLDQHVERNAAGDVIRIRATTSKDRHEASAQAAQRGAPRADEFEVSFTRDALGLELDRSLGGGVRSRWLRDKLGRPLQHEILIGTQRHRGVGYNWDVGGRLSRIIDALSGPVAFSHDMLGQLAGTTHADGRVELRLPDAVGNLFKRSDRADRRYGPAGQLLESIDVRGRITRYGYDAEGNLIEKRLQGGAVWRYAWGADGYLREVTRPDGTRVVFQYDALGRRVLKSYRGQHTRWIWDGDVPVHEWVEGELEPAIVGSNAEPRDSDDARVNRREAELSRHLVRGPPERGSRDQPITWLFEPDTFAPLARLQAGLRQNIVTDQLGSPIAMLNEQGEVTWSGELDTWGELRMSLGEAHACPFRYPGQYADPETGLHYNRFRYYDPESGQYASQDPIGLEGGLALHAYAPDPLVSADPLGLSTYGLTPGTGAPYRRLVPGTPGRVRGGSSTQLGRNMFHAMGMARNTRRAGYQAQHVIPSELRNHPVLRALGMDLDDASNGIFLPVPRGDVSPLSRHRGYHSVYNDFVRTRLDLINPADPLPSLDQQVAAVRDRLRYLQRQGLPLYPSQGASIALWTRMYR